jgi:thiamine biosynthesis lipoprotein
LTILVSDPLILRFIICSATISLLGSCSQSGHDYITLQGNAQGTTFNIQYQDADSRDWKNQVDSIFRVVDKSMSLWDSTSLISRVNRNENVQVDSHFKKVFIRSMEISKLTQGAFDVTVSPLVKTWGFSYKKGLPLPDSAAVDSILQFIHFEKVRLQDASVLKDDPRTELDFNAIAQGYTVDLICEFLDSKRINNYLVELGGEVRAKGLNPRDSVWVIGIDQPDPHSTEHNLQIAVHLRDKALATSGNYRKFIEKDGKKYSHVIDPHTGYPAEHTLLSVSVIAEDCMTADALATAFMVLGLERSFVMMNSLPVEAYFIYADPESGEILTESTPGFGK